MTLHMQLHHTATHCNTLQHTATHCNTKCCNTKCNCMWSVMTSISNLNRWSSLIGLFCHVLLNNRSLLPCSVEKRPTRSSLEIQIRWHTKYTPNTTPNTIGCTTNRPRYTCLYRHALYRRTHTLQTHAMHCNTLQHTATHCNTLQHTATQKTHAMHELVYVSVWVYVCIV